MEEDSEPEISAEKHPDASEMAMAMKNWVTVPDLDAACILIQLSEDSSQAADSTSSRCHRYTHMSSCEAEESVGDAVNGAAAAAAVGRDDRLSSSSSTSLSLGPRMKRDLAAAADSDDEKVVGLVDGCGEIEVYPLRKNRRFRSVLELYAMTKKITARTTE